MVYNLVHDLIGDLLTLTPSVLHLGGDEVSTMCWLQSSQITQWMAAQHILSVNDLMPYFFEKLFARFNTTRTTPVLSYDVLKEDDTSWIPGNTIIQSWMDPSQVRAG